MILLLYVSIDCKAYVGSTNTQSSCPGKLSPTPPTAGDMPKDWWHARTAGTELDIDA